jgi:hypothetical protein
MWRGFRAGLTLLPLLAASCAGLDRNDRGNLQPQTVRGPCQVKKFFLLGTTSVPTNMTVGNAGEACTFTVLNPDLQVVINAALVTGQASHGRASVGLVYAAARIRRDGPVQRHAGAERHRHHGERHGAAGGAAGIAAVIGASPASSCRLTIPAPSCRTWAGIPPA